MSISIKPDSWHVKDGNGQYRGTAIFSSTLPSEAQQIVTESIAEINAVKETIPADYTSMSADVDQLKNDSGVYECLTNSGEYVISSDDMESGVWNWSRKDDNAARGRTKFLIPVYAGMSISYENTTFDVYFGVLPTLTSMEYYPGLSGWKTDSSGVFNITADGYLTFAIRNHADTTATVDPADFDSVVTINTAQKNAIDQKADKTAATTTADGLMSAADKTKLDDVYADYSAALVAMGVI